MNVIQILRRARALVNYGWLRGTYYRSADCKFCLAGAIGAANHGVTAQQFKDDSWYKPTIPSFKVPSGAMKALGFRDESTLINWNDKEGRTKDEVLGRLDKAIQKESIAMKRKKR